MIFYINKTSLATRAYTIQHRIYEQTISDFPFVHSPDDNRKNPCEQIASTNCNYTSFDHYRVVIRQMCLNNCSPKYTT